jgi:hypothetical protein
LHGCRMMTQAKDDDGHGWEISREQGAGKEVLDS